MFEHLVFLERLDLQGVGITDLHENSFIGLEKMLALNMSHNNIPRLPEHILKPLKDLREINLFGNQLKEIPEELFYQNQNLFGINIGYNNLTYLSSNLLIHNPNLKQFLARQNQFEILPVDLFSHNSKLEKVNFRYLTYFNTPNGNSDGYYQINNLPKFTFDDIELIAPFDEDLDDWEVNRL